MKASLWIFVAVLAVGGMTGCGVEETGLNPVDQEQVDDDGFQAEIDDAVEPDGSATDDTGDEQPVANEPVADEPVEADQPADEAIEDVVPDEAEVAVDDPEETVAANADVVSSPGACQLMFSTLYVDGATSGEIRGSLPGVATWDAGPDIEDSDEDGYLEFLPAFLPTGTFDLSFVGGGNWALYGAKDQLLTMSAEARSFVSCNWFDGNEEVAADNPECHLRITVAADCTITGAGNMANLQ